MVNKKILIGSIIGVIVIGSLIFGTYLLLSPEPLEPQLWLENPTLDSPIESSWFWEYGTEGDVSDIEYSISSDHVNYRVLGEKKTVTLLYGVPNSSSSPGWGIFNNGGLLQPDNSALTSDGCWVYHYLDEGEDNGIGQVHNFPSVHFRTNLSMPDDMSDYVITDTSLEVIFNASVDINVDSYNDWDNTTNTAYIDADKFLIGDSANFYLHLSDINYSYPFRVANFETRDVALGQGDRGGFTDIFNITDRDLNYVNKEDLISALNTALETDNQNLSITLGLDIYCEDNKAGGFGDQDLWDYLYFKSCNLTVTYEKKIDYFTSISLNQAGRKITGPNIHITDANLNFKYKINDTWPITAPLSELRIYINDIFYDKETLKLSKANASYQEMKFGGLDITDFVNLNEDINLSIQIFLADNFDLNKVIEISIDDIFLYITLKEVGANWTPVIIGLVVGMVGLTTVFGLYFKIFQFPPLVRKIRKLSKKIRKGKSVKPLLLQKREYFIENNIKDKLKILNLELIDIAKTTFTDKIEKTTNITMKGDNSEK